MNPLDQSQIAAHVLCRQHLTPDSKSTDVIQVVKDICGLYAGSAGVPYLSLLARSPHFARNHLDEELYTRRTLGRIRCMRKAIYILPMELLAAAHWATRSLIIESSRRYLEYRGVSHRDYEKMARQIVELLHSRELTAVEVKHALRTSYDVAAVLNFMCDQAVLIRGRFELAGPDPTYRYALFSDYFPNVRLEPMGEREAAMRVVRCYLRSFGPATEDEIAWWTGLSRMSVHIALQHMRGEVVDVHIVQWAGAHVMLRADAEAIRKVPPLHPPAVNLLPGHDSYLLGYRQHTRYLADQYGDWMFDQTGNITPTILLNGRAIGIWDLLPDTRAVKLFLFERSDEAVMAAIDAAARQIGRFVCGGEPVIQWCATMKPLTQQPVGSVLAPLRDSE
jgi:hypothetical protein